MEKLEIQLESHHARFLGREEYGLLFSDPLLTAQVENNIDEVLLFSGHLFYVARVVESRTDRAAG